MLGDAGRPLVASLMQQGGLKAKRGRDGAEMGQMGGACLPSALDGWMLVCASSQRAWLVDGWTVDGGRWTVEGKDGCPLLLAWDAPDLGRANLTGQQTSRQDRTGQGRAATPPPVSFCCPPLPRTTQSPPSGTDFAVTKQEKTPSWQSVARLALPLPCAAVQCAVCSVQCAVQCVRVPVLVPAPAPANNLPTHAVEFAGGNLEHDACLPSSLHHYRFHHSHHHHHHHHSHQQHQLGGGTAHDYPSARLSLSLARSQVPRPSCPDASETLHRNAPCPAATAAVALARPRPP